MSPGVVRLKLDKGSRIQLGFISARPFIKKKKRRIAYKIVSQLI